MKKIRHICGWLLLIASHYSGLSQVKDTLFFHNGDLLIGELKSISLGKITFDDDNMDILCIKGTHIRTISASTHIYRLETVDDEIFYSSLETSTDGRVRIQVLGATKELAVADISKLIPFSKGLFL